jgi:hypothetical protein
MIPIGPAPVISTSVGVEDRGNLVRDITGDLESITGRNRQILGKSSVAINSDADRVATKVAPTSAAVAAAITGDVALARHSVTNLKAGHGTTNLGNMAKKLMPSRHRDRNSSLCPSIPIIDVQISPADCSLFNLNQQVVRPDHRYWYLAKRKSLSSLSLYESLHHLAGAWRIAHHYPHVGH